MEEDIITDLSSLQDRLNQMIARVEQRDCVLQQFQAFQTTLFTLNSLPELLDSVLAEVKLFFMLDTVNLVLLNEDAGITGYLDEAGYDYQKNKCLILLANKPAVNSKLVCADFIGSYNHAEHGVFFPGVEKHPRDVIIIPLTRHGEYLGSLNLASHTSDNLPDKMKLAFVAQIGFAVSVCLENLLNFAVARQTQRTQALVSANNRRFLEQRLVEELDREQRSAHSLSCVMLNVDFPAMKDQHQAAQLDIQILKTVAETVKRQLRVEDVFSYYEGKKFAAFLANVPESVLIAVTERIKMALAEQVINFANQIIPLTISLGSASYRLDNKPVEAKTNQQIALGLIAAADAKLYASKNKPSPQNKKLTAV